MKNLIALLVLATALLLGSKEASAAHRHQAHKPLKPTIVHQHSNLEGVRVIRIRNPGKAGYVYFECENVISVDPIRVPHGTHTIHLTTNRQYYIVSPPPCVISRWVEGENAP